MFRLDNVARAYDWGSRDQIAQFMGQPPSDRPVAEVWMGTHPLGMSSAVRAEERQPLDDISGELPFLLKLLAADRPLSLQVHPNGALSKAGFEADEAHGLELDDPARTYKDPHAKPEMVYALTTFDSLIGFRPTAEILRILGAIEAPLAQALAEQLREEPGFAGIVRLVERLVVDDISDDDITAVLASCRVLVDQSIDIKRAYATAVWVAENHPGDPGIVISLLLNRLTLQPGEAAFLDTGVIHAHLQGMCLEVMGASDNVLRAGLTSKPRHPAELVRCLDKGMSRLSRVTPTSDLATDVFDPGVGTFALSVTQCSRADVDGMEMPGSGRRIAVCTGGEVELINASGVALSLTRGDAVYVEPSDGPVRVLGTGEVAQAYSPDHP